MLTILNSQLQITIPKSIVANLGLKDGDVFEIFADEGTIRMIPTVVYPENYVNELNTEVKNLKNNIKAGKQPVFNNVHDLINALENS